MQDVEYVKSVLAQEYETSHPHEIEYPDLSDVIDGNEFDYPAGTVFGEKPNGSKSPEGHDYLWFKDGEKSILTHRFIVAVTIGKWVPRDFDVDHINHNPSDNRPENLRVVTRRDNNGNRRRVRLSELADLNEVTSAMADRKAKKTQEILEPQETVEDPFAEILNTGPVTEPFFTGETKPAEHSNGTWHKTNLGSWHLKFE